MPADSAAGISPDEQTDAQLKRLGVAEGDIEAARAAQAAEAAAQADADELVLWAWHMPALRLFKAMRSQWQMLAVGMGGILHVGLRYEALPAVEERLGLAACEDRFEQLQVMERAGRIWLNRSDD